MYKPCGNPYILEQNQPNWFPAACLEPVGLQPQSFKEKLMKRALDVLSSAIGVLLLCVSGFAQNIATANLRGIVHDQNGAVIQNANVTARLAGQNLERSTQSDNDGEYVFLNLPPGSYSIEVQASGFAKLVQNQVVLTIGQDAQLPVNMRVASATEQVTVESGAEIVET